MDISKQFLEIHVVKIFEKSKRISNVENQNRLKAKARVRQQFRNESQIGTLFVLTNLFLENVSHFLVVNCSEQAFSYCDYPRLVRYVFCLVWCFNLS